MAATGDFSRPSVHGFPDIDPELAEKKRQNYIKSTDSDYVKLAKQGGAKDLLTIEVQKPNKEAVDYPRSGWFGHHSMDEGEQQKILAAKQWEAPDYMTHVNEVKISDDDKSEISGKSDKSDQNPNAQPAASKPKTLTAREERLLIQAKYNNREVPFMSDNLSCWQRKEDPPSRIQHRK